MSELIVRSDLFYDYNGAKRATWYLCGDCTDQAERDWYLRMIAPQPINTVLLSLNNEGLMCLFDGGFMQRVNMGKVNMLKTFCRQLTEIGKMPAITFYDGPAIKDGKYHPILDCPKETHAQFIKAVCQELNQWAGIYLIGCETNRYWSTDFVTEAIAWTKLHAGLHPVGTHEQCGADRVFPRNADFCAYETRNHPNDGDGISVQDMVNEVAALQGRLPPGMPVWVAEYNWNHSQRQAEQGRAMAQLPGVLGMDGII